MQTKTRILVVDDEDDIREILQFNLENEGYLVDQASSAGEGHKILSTEHKLILLDVMMEGMSGFRYTDKLRKEGNNIPIIFLTAKDTENDMLTGFSIGADDYIRKPFSVKEVLARVRSVLHRYKSKMDQKAETIIIESLEIDTENKRVKINDTSIELTKTEYEILELLASNIDKTFSRSDILASVWRNDSYVLDRTVDVHIARLRKKIAEYGNYITNRTGYGYSFNSQNDN